MLPPFVFDLVVLLNPAQCPESCTECSSCVDPAVGCQAVADGESCSNGAGQCVGGVCGILTPPPSVGGCFLHGSMTCGSMHAGPARLYTTVLQQPHDVTHAICSARSPAPIALCAWTPAASLWLTARAAAMVLANALAVYVG